MTRSAPSYTDMPAQRTTPPYCSDCSVGILAIIEQDDEPRGDDSQILSGVFATEECNFWARAQRSQSIRLTANAVISSEITGAKLNRKTLTNCSEIQKITSSPLFHCLFVFRPRPPQLILGLLLGWTSGSWLVAILTWRTVQNPAKPSDRQFFPFHGGVSTER